MCHPVQMGVPSDKAQYVHRVGRTARAGKKGQALLMLCDFEAAFLDKVSAALCLAPMACDPEADAWTHIVSVTLCEVGVSFTRT